MAELATIALRDGRAIPQLGIGVFQIPPGGATRAAVEAALAAGYRHVDTPAVYRNESDVGAAIRASGLKPGAVWVTIQEREGSPPSLRKKRQVLRTRRPTGLDAATLTESAIAVNRHESGASRRVVSGYDAELHGSSFQVSGRSTRQRCRHGTFASAQFTSWSTLAP